MANHGIPIPYTLQPINTVYSSVCSDGRIYLGLQDGSGIVRLGEHNAVVTVTKEEKIQSFTVYNSKIYALIILRPPTGCEAVDDMPTSQSPKVRVYNALDGNQVTEWPHTADGAGSHSQLTVVNDQVAILCVTGNLITTYYLDGNGARAHAPREGKLSTNPTEFIQVCAAGGNCLVFSDYNSHQVVKFDLTKNEVIWRCKNVCNPRGVTHYKDNINEFILVTDLSPQPTVYMLDVETG